MGVEGDFERARVGSEGGAMNITQAKKQVKDTIEAYLATDAKGRPLLERARQRPIFLVGAPGIGKTAIMAQIASELEIGLVSYSMTHHTRQSALGLPFIVTESYGDFEYEASEYTMSEIVASVYQYMNEHGVDRGILFLDEINCVSETLYPSMLQFLQFKTFGRHAVPDGWIVVTAGNPPEYNKSVHEFDIVTLDRVKKISVEPEYESWRPYAISKEIHPAILTFLDIKKNRFYSIESSLDGKAFVTARGWDDLSDMIRVLERLEKPVDYSLIVQYVQSESIAREFAAYYDLFNKYRDDYRIDDILAGRAGGDVIERARDAEFDERLSIIGLMLDALCADMRAVMFDTDVLVSVRDDLREVKAGVAAGSDGAELLDGMRDERQSRLELSVAAGVVTSGKRDRLEREIDLLGDYLRICQKAPGSPDEKFAAVEAWFTEATQTLRPRADQVETKVSNAFDFIDEVLGDAQESLVFTTELTSRAESARFIAQYGSESYFEHNADMILSERQRDLLRRVEKLDL